PAFLAAGPHHPRGPGRGDRAPGRLRADPLHPAVRAGRTRPHPGAAARRSASRALVEAGLTEVTSSPFIAESVFDRLRYEVADERRSAVRLLNPLADDEPLMRTELLQTLLPTARRNLGRGEEAVAIFQHGTAAIAR